MSSGAACKNRQTHKPTWWVSVRKAHHSWFNGGRRTPSAYSEVRCGTCSAVWRSKATYVDSLPDSPANPDGDAR